MRVQSENDCSPDVRRICTRLAATSDIGRLACTGITLELERFTSPGRSSGLSQFPELPTTSTRVPAPPPHTPGFRPIDPEPEEPTSKEPGSGFMNKIDRFLTVDL